MALTETQILSFISIYEEEIADIRAQLAALRKQTVQGETRATTVSNYSTNDGQVSQSVTKLKTLQLRLDLKSAIAELSKYQSMLSGGGTCVIR